MNNLVNEVSEYLNSNAISITESHRYFRCSLNKDPISYICGEEMIFNIWAVENGVKIPVPMIKWYCDGDDGVSTEGVETYVSSEGIIIKTSVSVPGFVRVRAIACDKDGNPIEEFDAFEGGAGADTDKIECLTEVPSDFDEHWENILKVLDENPPEIISKKQLTDDNYPDFDVFDIQVSCPFDMAVSGILTMPKGYDKLPAVVSYMGYGVSPATSKCFDGYMTFHINAHGMPNDKDASYYKELSEGRLKEYGFNNTENEDKDKSYFKGIAIRALQAARFVKTLDKWDGKELVSFGGSQGALQAVSVAAHDKDVTKCIAVVPAFCDLEAVEKGRMGGWRPDFRKGLRYYDTAVQGSKIECPIHIQAGLGDYVCPPSSIMALYNNIKSPKVLEFIQNNTHGYRAPYYDYYITGTTDGVFMDAYDCTDEERLEKCKKLIEYKVLNTMEAVFPCGYKDHKFFYDEFKKKYGINPYEYRRLILAKGN